MKNVVEFIKFAVGHAKNVNISDDYIITGNVGCDGSWEYLWGCRGQVVTDSLLISRYNSYYKKNGWTKGQYDKATKNWVKDGKHVTDCQGLLDAYLGNDTNANGNYNNYCTEKGLCSAIKRKYVIGEAVFNGSDTKKTHVGWVCGFTKKGVPLVVEARGLAYGVVITNMEKRSWKYRGLMTKKFSYDESEPQPATSKKWIFTRPLKYGCKGDDVVELKKLLIADGYGDGITIDKKSSKNFYGATKKEVKAFQRDSGLTVDGIAGKNTITALGGVWDG